MMGQTCRFCREQVAFFQNTRIFSLGQGFSKRDRSSFAVVPSQTDGNDGESFFMLLALDFVSAIFIF
ncbi:MAG: hypothetical protein V2B20_11990 [Pseudomonadota bacterium]